MARPCRSIIGRVEEATFGFFLCCPKFAFRPGGTSGTQISDLFPSIRDVADELCVLRSLHTNHTNHYESTLGMHTGSFDFARPSVGAWVSYGLGTFNRNLPSSWSLHRRRRMQVRRRGPLTFCRPATREQEYDRVRSQFRISHRRPDPVLCRRIELEALRIANRKHLARRAARGAFGSSNPFL